MSFSLEKYTQSEKTGDTECKAPNHILLLFINTPHMSDIQLYRWANSGPNSEWALDIRYPTTVVTFRYGDVQLFYLMRPLYKKLIKCIATVLNDM